MVISFGRIVGRRLLAKRFPGGSRTYLTSASQNNALIDRGTWILSVVIGGIGGWSYSARADAESHRRLEAAVHARYLRETEALDKKFLEVMAARKADKPALASLEKE